ncbi:hypothetical protein [Mucilaginibacter sp. NFX135]|uniref:hypothetical protein n=1 Tax=Mucilaginibacter sp. NFX135 TaxID=3402687 RepID=UPI003AFB27F5
MVLFGSHAREDWVTDEYEEKGVVFSYESDYDFLVIIKKDGRKENEVSHQIESYFYDIKGDVSSLVHDIEYVNVGLSQGQYFFTEIINEGILLYDTNKFAFDKIKQHRLFNLLKLGYLNSRYQSDYSVNKQDVKALIGKVKQLEEVVIKLCLEKISSLG